VLQPVGGGSPKDDNAQQSGDNDKSDEEQSGDSEEESDEGADRVLKAKLLS
jgi:hypothetical protein